MERNFGPDNDEYGYGSNSGFSDRRQEQDRDQKRYDYTPARPLVNDRAHVSSRSLYNNPESRFGSGSMRGNESTTNYGSYSQGLYAPSPYGDKNSNHTGHRESYQHPEGTYHNFIHYNYGTPPSVSDRGNIENNASQGLPQDRRHRFDPPAADGRGIGNTR